MIELIDTLEVHNELGEGVIWDAQSQVVWWTDIQQKRLYQYTPSSKQLRSWQTPERLACMSPIENRAGMVAAFESGFAFYEPESGSLEWIKKLEQDNPGTRFNDGRTDRQGRFWAGTMVEDRDSATYKGSLYCLNQDLLVKKTRQGLSIPNSLCWSPDGRWMYHTDTPSRHINRYKFDPADGSIDIPYAIGTVSTDTDAHSFIETHVDCYPDGSTVDSEGGLWNAQWGASQVVRYTPDGQHSLTLPIPTKQPTCVAFAGPDLDLLVVTSAHQSMTPEQRENDPNAGNVFIYQTPFTGIAESRFKLRRA